MDEEILNDDDTFEKESEEDMPDICDCEECEDCIKKQGECTCGDCEVCMSDDEVDKEDSFDDMEPEDLL